jgi:hypothetical protein
MTGSLRSFARRLLGVSRHPKYCLSWIVRPGLECALVLSYVEARFKPEYASGPFRASTTRRATRHCEVFLATAATNADATAARSSAVMPTEHGSDSPRSYSRVATSTLYDWAPL